MKEYSELPYFFLHRLQKQKDHPFCKFHHLEDVANNILPEDEREKNRKNGKQFMLTSAVMAEKKFAGVNDFEDR